MKCEGGGEATSRATQGGFDSRTALMQIGEHKMEITLNSTSNLFELRENGELLRTGPRPKPLANWAFDMAGAWEVVHAYDLLLGEDLTRVK